MATLVSDTFTDTNGTAIASHTPDVDLPGWGWSGITGTWQIQSNTLQETSGAGGWRHAVIQGYRKDATVIVNVTVPAASAVAAGLFIRGQNGDNHWMIRNQTNTDTLTITEVNAGGQTERASGAATMDAGNTYEVKVITSGNTITAYWDTVEICSYASATFQNEHPIYGVLTYVGGGFVTGQFDSFSIDGTALPSNYDEWQHDTTAVGEHPIIKDDLLYAIGFDGASTNNNLTIYDPRSGVLLQRFSLSDDNTACAPVIDSSGNIHVFSTQLGAVFKYDKYIGLLNSDDTIDAIDFESLAYDSANGVIVVAKSFALVGLSISDYSTAWTAGGPTTTNSQYGSVLLNGSYFYFLDSAAVLYRLNIADGTTANSVDVSAAGIAGSYSHPLYDAANNYIYVSDFTGRTVYAVDLTAFTVTWSKEVGAAGDEIKRPMCYDNNVLFVTVRETAANYNSKVYALDVTNSGNILWTNTTAADADAQVSALLVDDDYLYATTYDYADDDYNKLIVLDRNTGAVLALRDQLNGVSSASPAARQGFLYLGLWDNNGIQAIKIRAGGGGGDFSWKADQNTYDGYIGPYMSGDLLGVSRAATGETSIVPKKLTVVI